MKRQKGITLIALVITIIVMLILVAVTVSVAINGGLIGKAEEAKNRTQAEIEKEQLTSAVLGTLNDDGTVNFTRLENGNLPTGFTGTNGTYTSSTGNTFTVNADGTVIPKEPTQTRWWEEKGLTSEYVEFGKTYSLVTEGNADDFTLLLEGGFDGIDATTCEAMIAEGSMIVGTDYVLIIDDDEEEYDLTVFDGVGTATDYKCNFSSSVEPTKESIMNYGGTISSTYRIEPET